MNRKIVFSIIFGAILVSVLTIVFIVRIKAPGLETQTSDEKTEHIPSVQILDDEAKYMTKDELIESFYRNYEAFRDVADYLLSKDGYTGIGISQDGDRIIIGSNDSNGAYQEVNIDIQDFEVGEQVQLICGIGLEGAARDVAGTRVYFSVRYFDPPPDVGMPGSRGVIYVPGGQMNASPQDELDKENWYYFFLRFD